MSNTDRELIAELRVVLTRQRYSPVVVGNYCAHARGFLDYLARRNILVADVCEAQVAQYLRHAIALFRKRRGRSPGPCWHSIPRSGIHALLRLAQGQWPPAPKVTCAADEVRLTICDEYETWLREERGLARPSIVALLWEARHFLAWQLERCGAESLMVLNVSDIDHYMDMRALKLTRKSLKDVAERLISLLRYLHRTGRTSLDLSPHVIAPLLYAYEGVPSILERDQIAAVLESARKDTTPVGLRDHAILQLLATYGLRSSEIRNLRLEDIDWRAESIRVRHTKTRACSFLPLMAPVGEAVLAYLRSGRPDTDVREIFIRTRAPYRRLGMLGSAVRRRLGDAGVKPCGKSGPHIFRHARAVEMLRASVPQKVIGDLLGHRSTEATAPYLKLATEDLRAIALDVPGSEVLS
ncbi:tyrosine-type recombinase/integrase [Aminobacter anthyllidis]|uniref:Tyrosine-type recombinase/integrase n=1 Tax=Aminobacter anthyllidis TaxID=1035067 RepID=A0A9X1AGZ9_9HYPH|nr:tyrosine-type recombinase/integrase [Aminobacter anthyllidis]MBT1159834.1 tyrosine-type recombinase/integrase [Aminobacter anthyllidis]